MAYIRVVYKTKEGPFDYIPRHLFNLLIARDEISHFYRPSEKRWVSTRFDAVREGAAAWDGPERRVNVTAFRLVDQEEKEGSSNADAHPAGWLESLWALIENS